MFVLYANTGQTSLLIDFPFPSFLEYLSLCSGMIFPPYITVLKPIDLTNTTKS